MGVLKILENHTYQEALAKGLLVQVGVDIWDGSPVFATRHLLEDVGMSEVFAVLVEYASWQQEPENFDLAAHDVFKTTRNGKEVWVVAQRGFVTTMYAGD